MSQQAAGRLALRRKHDGQKGTRKDGATEAHHVGSGPEEDRGCSTGKVGENQEAEESLLRLYVVKKRRDGALIQVSEPQTGSSL